MGSALRRQSDRLVAVAFVVMVTLTLAGIAASETGATFTGSSTNPNDHFNTMTVQPPASQNAPTSGSGGVVNLSWTATPTVPGTGHTLSYLVFRGPVGGPYTQIGTTTGLTYSDTPSSDGTYGYVIQAKITGGGSFTSGNSASQSGISDRTAPTMTILCNGGSCGSGWYTAAVSVTVAGVDSGTGMGSVTYKLDAGSQISTSGSSVGFTVSGDSTGHTVQYFGTDAAGNSSSTLSQTIKIDGTAPTNATGLTSTTGSTSGTINLSWTAGSDATSGLAGYTIHRSGISSSCPTTNTTNYPNTYSVGAVTGTTITGLSSGSKYCFYITANDNAGNSSGASTAAGPTKAK